MARSLEPVVRESTPSIIADQIRAGIMSGLFNPGQQMGEAQLAQRLKVSRGVLREAMQRLVQEGLLRSERYRGLFVVDLTIDDVWDIYVTREAIERAAVRSILRADAPSLDKLARLVKRMESAAARNRGLLPDLDQQFHAALVEASGSLRLRRVARSLLVETQLCLRRLQHRYADATELVTEHRDILDALVARDEHRALDLVSHHMADAVARLGASDAEARRVFSAKA